jgi:hypothetical protein
MFFLDLAERRGRIAPAPYRLMSSLLVPAVFRGVPARLAVIRAWSAGQA